MMSSPRALCGRHESSPVASRYIRPVAAAAISEGSQVSPGRRYGRLSLPRRVSGAMELRHEALDRSKAAPSPGQRHTPVEAEATWTERTGEPRLLGRLEAAEIRAGPLPAHSVHGRRTRRALWRVCSAVANRGQHRPETSHRRSAASHRNLSLSFSLAFSPLPLCCDACFNLDDSLGRYVYVFYVYCM